MPKIVDEQMREATRHHVLHYAASEFARLGFDQANINVIAEQAGMGKGTIYLYFENKRELFLAMLRQIAQTQLASVRLALAQGGTLRQQLERLFRCFVQLAEEDSDGFHVYMSSLHGVNRAFQAEATKLLRDYVAIIASLLEQAQASGEVRGAVNIENTALMILSLIESYVLSARVLGQSSDMIIRQAPHVATLVLDGLEI
jgi:AcrR family transcriptional regulator